MTNKINNNSRKLNYKQLQKRFPRLQRQNDKLTQHSSYEGVNFGLGEDSTYGIANDKPFEGSVLFHEVNIKEVISYSNSLLLYRILKLSYKNPDVLAAYIDVKSNTATPLDWGYLLQINNDLLVEIRTIRMNTRQVFRFWYNKPVLSVDKKKVFGSKMVSFFKELTKSIKENMHLFDEKDVIGHEVYSALSNIFARRYKSAEELLVLAQLLDRSPDQMEGSLNEKPSVTTKGSLYLSAAIFFIIALESLVNILFHCLLKEECRNDIFKKITKLGDLEFRLASIHLFCFGFTSPIFESNTGLRKRYHKLRVFRNDIIHGNITDNHQVYSFQEDCMQFFYLPNNDFRGFQAEKKAANIYPTSMTQIKKNHVMEIKESVDLIIKSISDSADVNTREWIDGWLWEIMIPRHYKLGENKTAG